VWFVDFDPVRGREQGKDRPALVVSSHFHLDQRHRRAVQFGRRRGGGRLGPHALSHRWVSWPERFRVVYRHVGTELVEIVVVGERDEPHSEGPRTQD